MKFEDVWILIKKIPRGRVTTYKELARVLGTKAYRAIGNACNKNPYSDVPCHRVIKSNGEIGGFARGVEEKIRLLEKEGVKIIDGKIDLKKYFFKFV
ncbi:MAG: MGMT family protein [Candidatus Aenigmarchaeota archaeon]|nr:MGMT family protein [Candidatus Aenigmarchaeota archaeon]MBU5689021.1 MGMT family protein [Candidatus Aenigmarchaeota archaeon]